MAQTPIKLGFYDNIGKNIPTTGKSSVFSKVFSRKSSTFSQLSPRLPKARGVRCAPSLKAVCAVCGGSEVARGVRFGPGAERRAAAASCAVPWGDVSVEGGCGR